MVLFNIDNNDLKKVFTKKMIEWIRENEDDVKITIDCNQDSVKIDMFADDINESFIGKTSIKTIKYSIMNIFLKSIDSLLLSEGVEEKNVAALHMILYDKMQTTIELYAYKEEYKSVCTITFYTVDVKNRDKKEKKIMTYEA